MAFRDVRPVAPSHFLVIPKNRMGLTGIRKAKLGHVSLLGHLLYVASHVASKDPLLNDGYRIVINDGKHGGKHLSLIHFFKVKQYIIFTCMLSVASSYHGHQVSDYSL